MQLELNFQDDEHDPEKSVNAYNTLKDAGMKLLVGTVTSAPCVAVSAEAAKRLTGKDRKRYHQTRSPPVSEYP